MLHKGPKLLRNILLGPSPLSMSIEDDNELAHNASNPQRRRFLTIATSVVGTVGEVGAAVQSWKPSARARALAAPIRVDVSRLAPGKLTTASHALRIQGRGIDIDR